MKKHNKIIITAICGLVLGMCILVGGFVAYILFSAGGDVSSPKVTYGEFPFRLEYEINGAKVVIEDTLICKYKGVRMDRSNRNYRKWKTSYLSGRKRIEFDQTEYIKESEFGKEKIKQIVYFDPGPAEYHMGLDYCFTSTFPGVNCLNEYKIGWGEQKVSDKELYDKFGIKLISWDIAEPIENELIDD